MRRIPRGARGAFSMIETAMATAVTSGLVIAALAASWGATRQRSVIARTTLGSQLAHELLGEIMAKPYSDPDGLALLGIELAELAAPGRATFDDVDDYDGYQENLVVDGGGRAIVAAAGYKRTVRVKWVSTADGATESGAETGLKRITVTVSKGGVVIAKAVGLRSRACDEVTP